MRILKKLAAALFMVVLTASSAFAIVYGQAGYETYGNDESTAWEIDSVATLKSVRNDLNSGRINTLLTKYYRLTRDLDITSEISWTPIGSESKPFNGVFDGGGHTIRVLMSTSSSITSYNSGGVAGYTGFFGYVDEGTVKNLNIKGKVIGSFYNTWSHSYQYSGGIAAYVKTGTIQNCKFDGEVKSTASHKWSSERSYAYAGGIIARNGGKVIITNCSVGVNDSETKITATRTGDYSDSGTTYAGGIIGYFYDQDYRNTISYNYSRVTLDADETRNRIYGYRDGTSGTLASNTDIDPYASYGTPPSIAASTLSSAYYGEAYSAALSATGDSPITWSLYSGNLPSGLYLSSAGTVSGTPTATGSYTFTVMASNSSGSDTKSFSITVNNRAVAPSITTSSYLGQFVKGDSLNLQLYASGTTPLTWSYSGTLPAGLSLSSSGILSGTLNTNGDTTEYYFNVTASNSAGSDSQQFEIDVLNPYVEIYTSYLYNGTVGQYYSDWVFATGSNLPSYEDWVWTASGLPSGLTMDSDGNITGTPTTAGTYTVSITAANGAYSATKSYTITIDPAPIAPPVITTSYLPVARVNRSYSFQLSAESETDVEWSIFGLPSGLSVTSSGLIYGTPTVTWNSSLTVYAENEGGTTVQFLLLTVEQPSGIEINSENFPDYNFRSYVSSNLDSDGDGWLDSTEISAVTSINVRGMGISSVQGIEYFTSLTSLTVWDNSIEEIDLSSNSELSYFDCDNNRLTELDLSWNPSLRTVYCQNNQLEYIDVSGNTSLQNLYCNGNNLYELDLSSNYSLSSLSCYSNKMPALYLGNNSSLTYPSISNQYLGGLEVSKESGNSYYSVYLADFVDVDMENINPDTVRSDSGNAYSFNASTGEARFYSLPENVIYDYDTGLTDSDGNTIYMTVYVYPNDEPTIVTSSLPAATQGSDYSAYLEASSRTSVTWELEWGNLPSGLTLDSGTGKIYGTPLISGTYYFGAKAYNDYGESTYSYTLTVNVPAVTVYPPSITTSYLDSGSIGTYYYDSVFANGTTPLTWNVSGLPAGLSWVSLSSSGAILGTPTEAGSFTVSITALNSAGSSTATYSLTINETAPSISTTTIPDGQINTDYSTALYASGSSVTWSLSSGSLPSGLSLNGDGTISGTPTEEGTFTFTITASNSAGSDSRTYTFDVDGIAPTITTSEISSGRENQAYSFTFAATGSGTITWSYSGTIPTGLELSSSGTLSGTPTIRGRYIFSVIAENATGSDSRSFTLVIDAPVVIPPSITTASLAPATIGTAYSAEFSATGTAPITWTASGLPNGLSLSESGTLSGTPTEAGTFNITVTATNASGTDSASVKTFALTVNGIAPEITTSSIPAGTVGTAYSATFGANGTAPITWTYSGTLPNGVSLSEAGVLSGTPTVAGTFNISVTAANTAGSVSKNFTLTVNASAPRITTTSIPSGMINTAYSAALSASGIPAPVWSCSGLLPEGLSLSSEGTISGTPKTSGSFDITVTAENSGGSDSKSYTLFIDGTPPSIKISGNSYGVVGKTYSALIETTGTRPITLSLNSGSLPDGLTLNSANSTISGTFTAQGVYTFELKAVNVAGEAIQQFTITVHEPVAPVIKTTKIPDGYNGEEYSFKLEAEGSPELIWSAEGLPNGLEITEDGEITGTIDTSKTSYKVKVQVKNDEGDSKVKTYTFKVQNKQPVFKTEELKAAKWGSNYSFTIKTGNFKPTAWSIVGDLPEGIEYNQKGKLSGKPLEVGEFDLTVIAGNGAVEIAQDFTLTVKGIPPKIKGAFKKGTENTPYTSVLKATGTTPIEWEFEDLPDGLDYSTDVTGEVCTISGTPTGAFSDTIAVTITNGANDEDSLTKHMKMTIKAVTPKFKTKASEIQKAWKVGDDFSYQIVLADPKPFAVEWELTGNIPEGLHITDEGLLEGEFSQAEKCTFSVVARNASKETLKKALKLSFTITDSNKDLPAVKGDVPAEEPGIETETTQTEFTDGIAYYERGELKAEVLSRAANNGEIIVYVFPAIEVDEARLYEFTVQLEETAEAGASLVWHSYPDGEYIDSESEEVFFLNDENEMIDTVPESKEVTVNAWLEPGVVYEPVIAVKIQKD